MGARGGDALFWRPSPFVEIIRYALAAMLVSTLAGGGIFVVTRLPDGAAASDADDAVLVDLPPVIASSAPKRDVADGPEQQATTAAAAVPRLEATKVDKPPADPKPAQGEIAMPEKTKTPPPPPVVASAAQEETGVSGADTKPMENEAVASEAERADTAKAISVWQRSMLGRLQIAKSGMRTGGEYGTIEIVFSIDGAGRLVASRIQRGSGSPRLDRAALLLVQRAAPFPAPPPGLTPFDLTFKIPVVFGHRQRSP